MLRRALQVSCWVAVLSLCMTGCGKPDAPAPKPEPKPAPAEKKKAIEKPKPPTPRKKAVAKAPPGPPIKLPASEQKVLDQREAGELKIRQVAAHARGLTDRSARRDFLMEWFRLEEELLEKEQQDRVGGVQDIIKKVEEQLTWPDDKLQPLAPDKTPVAIRAALKAKLGAEKSRLSANQKMIKVLRMELGSIRRRFAADLK